MKTRLDRPKAGDRQPVANDASAKPRESESTSRFSDNRPHALAQRKLWETAIRGPRLERLRISQRLADDRPPGKQAAQLNAVRGSDFQAIQLRMWDNVAATFSTDNDNPLWQFLGNSVYEVTAHGMRRYAPINWYRSPDEVSHDYDDRHVSFMNDDTAERFMDEVDEGSTFTAVVNGNNASITPRREDEDQAAVAARLDSASGLGVVDFDYDDATQSVDAGTAHWGHDAIAAPEGATADAPAERPPLPEVVEGEEDPYAEWRDA